MSRMTSDGSPVVDGGERGIAVVRQAGLIALVLEDAGNELPNIRFVVDDQNVRCHWTLLPILPSAY